MEIPSLIVKISHLYEYIAIYIYITVYNVYNSNR